MLELFTPIWFRFPILTNIVSIGLVQPPTSMKIRMNYEGNLKKNLHGIHWEIFQVFGRAQVLLLVKSRDAPR